MLKSCKLGQLCQSEVIVLLGKPMGAGWFVYLGWAILHTKAILSARRAIAMAVFGYFRWVSATLYARPFLGWLTA